jgi:hypothetical protein
MGYMSAYYIVPWIQLQILNFENAQLKVLNKSKSTGHLKYLPLLKHPLLMNGRTPNFKF